MTITDDDTTGPVISDVDAPAAVLSDQDTVITATISDATSEGSGVASATLYYGYSSPYTDAIATGTGPGGNGDGEWSFTIPAQGPDGEEETLKFYVEASDGDNSAESSTDNNGSNYYCVYILDDATPAPVVDGVTPDSAPLGQETAVTITGESFIGASEVKLDDPSSTSLTNVSVNSATEIVATVPAGVAVGVYNIIVTTPAGSNSTSAEKFTVYSPPIVLATSPTAGKDDGATSVTITGQYFGGATSVALNTTPTATPFGGTILVYNGATQIAGVHVPAGVPPGVYDVIVTTPYGSNTTSAQKFTVYADEAPVVTDDGLVTPSDSELHASWSAGNPQAGVVAYHYCIYSSAATPDTADVVAWTPNGTATEVTKDGLSLTRGETYCFGVKTQYGPGAWSDVGTSNGITVLSISPTTSGALTSNEAWAGLVDITGDVTVPSGVTLRITPGTTVRFAALSDDTSSGSDTSRCELIVQGVLRAEGVSGNEVTFTSSSGSPQRHDWVGLRFLAAQAGCSVAHARVEYGGKGLYVEDTTLTVHDSKISLNSEYGLEVQSASTLTLADSTVADNGGHGLYVDSDRPFVDGGSPETVVSLTGNVLRENGADGIHFDTNGFDWIGVTVNENLIFDNSGAGVGTEAPGHTSLTGELGRNAIHGNQGAGIWLYVNEGASDLTLTGNDVYENNDVGVLVKSAWGTLSGNQVHGNAGTGLSFTGYYASVAGNSIYENTGNGIECNARSVPVMSYNNLYGNAGAYELKNDWSYAIDARHNWWGATTTAEMDAGTTNITRIYDLLDDGTKGLVLLSNWRAEALTAGPGSGVCDPVPGAEVWEGLGTYTVRGFAWPPVGESITLVEVSTDGGTTWSPATGTTSWTYVWTLPSPGAYTIKTRATDSASAVETPDAGKAVTVTGSHLTTSGTLPGNETWSGTVDVTGDVRVPAGVTLTIAAGTTVRFSALSDDRVGGADTSRCELIVQGVLLVQGTAGSKVTFTSSSGSPQRHDWLGLRFLAAQAGCSVAHAIVEYGGRGLYVEDTTLTVHNSQVSLNSEYGLEVQSASTLTLADSTAADNGSHGLYVDSDRPFVDGGSPETVVNLTGNVVRDNGADGIHFETNGFDWIGVTASENVVSGNGGAGVGISGPGQTCLAATFGRNTIYENQGAGMSLSVNQGSSDMTLSGNHVYGNEGAGLLLGTAWGTLRGNEVHGNAGIGLSFTGYYASVAGNSIYENTGDGIECNARSVSVMSYNNLYSNAGAYELKNDSSHAIDARHNWWGAATTAEMMGGTQY